MFNCYEDDRLHIPKIIKLMNQKQLERCICIMDFFYKFRPRRIKKKFHTDTKFNV